jgi:DNA-binding CsgD family transcriptional regulator
MSASKAKPRIFDIKEYSEKVKATLSNLEKMQQPGQQSGKGGKTDVLNAAKKEIQELLKKGYTTKQIADALSNDIFGILPKTITQLVSTKQTKATSKGSHTPPPPAKQKEPHATSTVNKSQGKKPVTTISDVE